MLKFKTWYNLKGRQKFPTLFETVGAGVGSYGLWLAYHPLGFIGAGAWIVLAANSVEAAK